MRREPEKGKNTPKNTLKWVLWALRARVTLRHENPEPRPDMSFDASNTPVISLVAARAAAFPAYDTPYPSTNRGDSPVFVRDHMGLHRIDRRDVSLLKTEGNYVELYTTARRYVLRNSLCEVLTQLGHDLFVQVNRNTAVNLQRIDRVDHDEVEMDGKSITLSRCFRTALLQRIRVLGGR